MQQTPTRRETLARRALRTASRAAIAVAAIWLLVVSVLYAVQRRLVFHPDTERVAPAAVRLTGFAEEPLVTPDGIRLITWWAAPRPGRPVVLYFHGNGGNVSYRAGRYGALHDAGYGVLALSWRGYGGSSGSPGEAELIADGRLALASLGARGIPPARVVLFGESLGTGVAVQVAAGAKVAAVILDSPFTSAADVAAGTWWFVPVHLLMRDRFDSRAHIAAIGVPLLIVHGDRDAIVPHALGRQLFAAAHEPKRHVTLPGGGHTVPFAAGSWAPVRTFLADLERGAFAR